MGAIFFRVGDISEPKSVQALLREAHEDRRREVLEDIATRTEAHDVPLDDGDGPLTDPGPYKHDKRLEGVYIRVRNLDADEIAYMTTHARAQYLFDKMSKTPDDIDGIVERSLALERRSRREMRDFVVKAIAEISGDFGDGRGVNIADDIVDLEANGLLVPLFSAARRYQELTAAEKKTCGSSGPPISASSIVTPAPELTASSSGVMAAPKPAGINTIPRGASATRAQSVSPYESHHITQLSSDSIDAVSVTPSETPPTVPFKPSTP